MFKEYIIAGFIIVILAVTLLLCGCKDDYHDGLVASDIKVELDITPTTVHFSAEGEEKAIFIKSNASWEITSDADWVKISPLSGKNDATIVINASINAQEKDRECTVKIKEKETNTVHEVTLNQSAQQTILDYVDMGLPSGVLWATCNLGAKTPYEYGDYYSFGEVKPKYDYSRDNYPYLENNSPVFDYITYTDNDLKLPPQNDAAYQKLGEGWHIPTYQEFRELRDNCYHKWVENYGDRKSSGYLFTATNGNELFLPAAGCIEGTQTKDTESEGYYRTSTMLMKGFLPYIVIFYWKEFIDTQTDGGYFGYSIRPVYTSK